MNTTQRSFIINGVACTLPVEDRQNLADLLRDQLGLTGCKVGCDQAVCGACTVLVDGCPVAACATFAFMAEGAAITTIEGLAAGTRLDPVQQAFLEAGAVQCGFCTSGMVLSVHAMLARTPDPDDATIRAWLGAHVCRCTGYAAILDAVRLAARHIRAEAA
ncbi:MAG: (2Fe-2S)-binding protein [Alphaproteobacteria bacterium]|nr:(2Fe-2S)-binding protein [Alphaproteobacteria bacterium]